MCVCVWERGGGQACEFVQLKPARIAATCKSPPPPLLILLINCLAEIVGNRKGGGGREVLLRLYLPSRAFTGHVMTLIGVTEWPESPLAVQNLGLCAKVHGSSD